MIIDDLRRTRCCCEEALLREDLAATARVLEREGVTSQHAVHLVQAVIEDPATHAPLHRLKRTLAEAGVTSDQGALERLLLIYAVLDALPKLPSIPVSTDVQRLFCEAFRLFASEPERSVAAFDAGSARFIGLCKLATLRRFPAGQFDWEVSGISRSYVMKVSLHRLPETIAFVVFRMGGLGPVFFSHLGASRPNRSLVEDEANRSYYRMAKAMEQQSHIKGFAACSWFRSPGTHHVSPHLAWLSRVFLENGGLVVQSGPDDPNGGALGRSKTRRRLYEAGKFTPTRGLVLWPRAAMLAWAAAHPEYESSAAD
jgi:hypothetical protein